MIDKAYLIAQSRHETACILHLAGKLDAGKLDWRPTPQQRSTIELLRYLALTSIGVTRYFLDGNWDYWERREKELSGMPLSGFPAEMRRQQEEFEAALAPLTGHDLAHRQVQDWFGQRMEFDQALLNYPLRFLSTYKMQLFLYAKQCGAAIGSANLWMGKDQPPKAG